MTRTRSKIKKKPVRVDLKKLGTKYSLPLAIFVMVIVGVIGARYVLMTFAATTSSSTFDDAKAAPYPIVSADIQPDASGGRPAGCYYQFSSCYYYVGGVQYNILARGASVTMRQSAPKLGSNDNHSVAELWVGTQEKDYQAIEVGWFVAQGDDRPKLFVYHWVNGRPTCYNACGFQRNINAPKPVGSAITPGADGLFKIQYDPNTTHWNIYFNNNLLGYYPASLWSNFHNVHEVNIYGEVGASATQNPKTDMGNGAYGTASNSAFFSNYHLINTNVNASLGFYQSRGQRFYNGGYQTATGFHYGGPGG